MTDYDPQFGFDFICKVAGESKFYKLPQRCKSIKKYNGIRKPKCSKGKGCQDCWQIYWIKNNLRKYEF